ncbi:MAG: phosphatase PAP2 family protein [Bdellovibrionales bacterium]
MSMSLPFASFDLPIQRFITQFSGSSDTINHIIYGISALALVKGVFLFSLLWFAWFYKNGAEDPDELRKTRETILVVFFSTLAAVVLARLMQSCLSIHPRPFSIMTELGLQFPVIRNSQGEIISFGIDTANSFPSDHAVYFAALSYGLWSINRRLGALAFFWTVVVISLPRIYIGLHYPSDVVIGLALGVLLMFAALKVSFFRSCANMLLRWSEKHQGLFYWLAFITTINAAALFTEVRLIIQKLLMFLSVGALTQLFH